MRYTSIATCLVAAAVLAWFAWPLLVALACVLVICLVVVQPKLGAPDYGGACEAKPAEEWREAA